MLWLQPDADEEIAAVVVHRARAEASVSNSMIFAFVRLTPPAVS